MQQPARSTQKLSWVGKPMKVEVEEREALALKPAAVEEVTVAVAREEEVAERVEDAVSAPEERSLGLDRKSVV